MDLVTQPIGGSQEYEVEHYLVLRPLGEGLFIQKEVKLDLAPVFNKQKNIVQSIVPKYKSNLHHMMPAFDIEFQNDGCWKTDLEHSEIEKQNVNKEVSSTDVDDLFEQDSEILQPAPRHKFCGVCKQAFTDYLQHIRHPSHKKSLKKKKSNRYIEELSTQFQLNIEPIPNNLSLKRTISLDQQFMGKRKRIQTFDEISQNIHKKRNVQSYSTTNMCLAPQNIHLLFQ